MDLFEIVLILAVALIVLGPERLPEVMRVTGKVLRELRLASNTMLRELTDAIDEQPANVSAPAAAAAPKPAAPDKPPEQT